MKKLFAVVLALVMVFALCACGSEPADEGWAYDEYITEEQYNKLADIVEVYVDNVAALKDLCSQVELDDNSAAAIEAITGDVDTLVMIVNDPTTIVPGTDIDDLIATVESQNSLVELNIEQVSAVVNG